MRKPVWPEPGAPVPNALHAVAALALYGQPFGFTHEDVRVLRGLASWVPREWQPDGERVLRSLADRIEALLPPEVPNA